MPGSRRALTPCRSDVRHARVRPDRRTGEVDLFTLSGQAGQIISLALASTGGFSTNPAASTSVELSLFAPSGAAAGSCGRTARPISRCRKPALRDSRECDQSGADRFLPSDSGMFGRFAQPIPERHGHGCGSPTGAGTGESEWLFLSRVGSADPAPPLQVPPAARLRRSRRHLVFMSPCMELFPVSSVFPYANLQERRRERSDRRPARHP